MAQKSLANPVPRNEEEWGMATSATTPCVNSVSSWSPPLGVAGKEAIARRHVRASGRTFDGDAPERIRTSGLSLRRAALYPLSYGRPEAKCSCVATL